MLPLQIFWWLTLHHARKRSDHNLLNNAPSGIPSSDDFNSDDHHLVHHTLMDHHLNHYTLMDHHLILTTIIWSTTLWWIIFWLISPESDTCPESDSHSDVLIHFQNHTSRITHLESHIQNHTYRCSDPRPDCTARLCTHVQHESTHRSTQTFLRVPASHFQPMSRPLQILSRLTQYNIPET